MLFLWHSGILQQAWHYCLPFASHVRLEHHDRSWQRFTRSIVYTPQGASFSPLIYCEHNSPLCDMAVAVSLLTFASLADFKKYNAYYRGQKEKKPRKLHTMNLILLFCSRIVTVIVPFSFFYDREVSVVPAS